MADPTLRILLLASATSAHTGRWVRGLTDLGHTVSVASPTGQNVSLPSTTVWCAPRQPVHRHPAVVRRWIHDIVRSARPDVVHVQSLGACGLLALALPRRIPLLATPWGSELRHHHPARWWIARSVLQRAKQVLTTSQEMRDHVICRFGARRSGVEVVSWGVDDKLFSAPAPRLRVETRQQLGIPPGARVAISIRATSATYRTKEITESFAAAAASHPGLFLILVDGHQPSDARAAAAQLAYRHQVHRVASTFAHRVRRHGLVTHDHMFALMCASDLAVSAPQHDQRSTSVLEAALAGCRLLLSDIPVYREIRDDGMCTALLPPPVADNLETELRTANRPSDVQLRRTRRFLQEHERWSTQVRVVSRYYQLLATENASRLVSE